MEVMYSSNAGVIQPHQNNVPSEAKLMVHHQYPDIELGSPICFCSNGAYYVYPVKKVDDGIVMNISFRLDQDEPGGILMYKVQRNGNARSDQSNIDTIYAKVIEEASKMMLILITWKIERSGEPKVNIILVEYDSNSILSKDKLARLYDKIIDMHIDYYPCILCSGIYIYFEYTVLMYNNTALKITYEVMEEVEPELKITISEGVEDEYTMKPMWINPERQVPSLMIIYFVLIYIPSLTLQSTIDLTIDNRRSNMELVSLIYFIKDATCHIQLPQQVDAKSIMKANFVTGVNQNTFGGALLYHLQRKENGESDDRSDTDATSIKDIPISTQLLVIWGCKFNGLYSRVYIIEHDGALTWNENKLKMLYDVYNNQYQMCSRTGDWWLDDGTMLKTKCKILHGGFKIDVIISEQRPLSLPRKPLWLDPNRQVPTKLMLSCINRMLSVFFFKMCSLHSFIISV
jgi:hypothetical protein